MTLSNHSPQMQESGHLTSSSGEGPTGWRRAITEACEGEFAWQARKFIDKLDEHQRRYPAFKPERVAERFLLADPKKRGWYCYQPISIHTRAIHKLASLQSLARNEHL